MFWTVQPLFLQSMCKIGSFHLQTKVGLLNSGLVGQILRVCIFEAILAKYFHRARWIFVLSEPWHLLCEDI
jgi:hypothetical protein